MCLLFSRVSSPLLMPRGWHQAPSGWWQKSIRGPQPSHRSSRVELARRTPHGSSASCEIQIQNPAGGRQDRGVQEFHRTCRASRCLSGGHNQESSRTKRRIHGRGGGCRAKVVTVAEGDGRVGEERDQLRQGVSKNLCVRFTTCQIDAARSRPCQGLLAVDGQHTPINNFIANILHLTPTKLVTELHSSASAPRGL